MHTQGPWRLDGDRNIGWDVYDDRHVICEIDIKRWVSPEESEANARLIAAAPELLAALEGLMSVLLSKDVDARITAHKAADAAIHLVKHGAAPATTNEEAV